MRDKWVIWCNLNIEQDKLEQLFGNDCVSVKGATAPYKKVELEKLWRNTDIPIMISKPKIFGHGLNWQCCHNVVFFGLSDSFEQYYQAMRRCWRFGQKYPVNVHIIIGEREKAVLRNIERKEKDSQTMFKSMVGYMKQNMINELSGLKNSSTPYEPKIEMKLPTFLKEA